MAANFAEADCGALAVGEREEREACVAFAPVEADRSIDQRFAVVGGEADEGGERRIFADAELRERQLGGLGRIQVDIEHAVPEVEGGLAGGLIGGDQGDGEGAFAEERYEGVGGALGGVAGDGELQPEHLFADRRALALDAHARPDERLAEEVGFGVDQLSGGVVVDAEGGSVLPVGGLVDAVAGGVEGAVDGDIALRGERAALCDADPAAEVEGLSVVREAGDGIVDDDLDLWTLRAGREEGVAFAFGDPELVFLAAEFGDQRRAEQEQKGEVGDKGGELGPAEAVGEQLDSVVGFGDLLHAVASRAEGGDERLGARARRGGLGEVESETVSGALEVGGVDAARGALDGAPDGRGAADGADGDRDGDEGDQRVPVGLLIEVEDAAVGVVEPRELGERVGGPAEGTALGVDVGLDLAGDVDQLGRDLGDDDAGGGEEGGEQDQAGGPADGGQAAPDPVGGVGEVDAAGGVAGVRADCGHRRFDPFERQLSPCLRFGSLFWRVCGETQVVLCSGSEPTPQSARSGQPPCIGGRFRRADSCVGVIRKAGLRGGDSERTFAMVSIRRGVGRRVLGRGL